MTTRVFESVEPDSHIIHSAEFAFALFLGDVKRPHCQANTNSARPCKQQLSRMKEDTVWDHLRASQSVPISSLELEKLLDILAQNAICHTRHDSKAPFAEQVEWVKKKWHGIIFSHCSIEEAFDGVAASSEEPETPSDTEFSSSDQKSERGPLDVRPNMNHDQHGIPTCGQYDLPLRGREPLSDEDNDSSSVASDGTALSRSLLEDAIKQPRPVVKRTKATFILPTYCHVPEMASQGSPGDQSSGDDSPPPSAVSKMSEASSIFESVESSSYSTPPTTQSTLWWSCSLEDTPNSPSRTHGVNAVPEGDEKGDTEEGHDFADDSLCSNKGLNPNSDCKPVNRILWPRYQKASLDLGSTEPFFPKSLTKVRTMPILEPAQETFEAPRGWIQRRHSFHSLSMFEGFEQNAELEADLKPYRRRRNSLSPPTPKSPFSTPSNPLFSRYGEGKKGIFHTILTRIRNDHNKRLEHGYIYCYTDSNSEGFLKIGHAKCGCSEPVNHMKSPDGSPPPLEVQHRIRDWSKCDGAAEPCVKLLFWVTIPQATMTIEKCIHDHLKPYRYIRKCIRCTKAKGLVKGHNEWFNIDENHAQKVVDLWRRFSCIMPYDANGGALSKEWLHRTCGALNNILSKRKIQTSVQLRDEMDGWIDQIKEWIEEDERKIAG